MGSFRSYLASCLIVLSHFIGSPAGAGLRPLPFFQVRQGGTEACPPPPSGKQQLRVKSRPVLRGDNFRLA